MTGKWGVELGVGEAWSGWKHLEQIVFRDQEYQEKQTIHDVSALFADARIYARKSSVAEFPCSLNRNLTICHLDMLFWLSANTYCILSPHQSKQHVFLPKDFLSYILYLIYFVHHLAGWLQDKWKRYDVHYFDTCHDMVEPQLVCGFKEIETSIFHIALQWCN